MQASSQRAGGAGALDTADARDAAGRPSQVRILPDAVHTAAAAAAALGVEVGPDRQLADLRRRRRAAAGAHLRAPTGWTPPRSPRVIGASAGAAGQPRISSASTPASRSAGSHRSATPSRSAPWSTPRSPAYDEIWAAGGVPRAVFPTTYAGAGPDHRRHPGGGGVTARRYFELPPLRPARGGYAARAVDPGRPASAAGRRARGLRRRDGLRRRGDAQPGGTTSPPTYAGPVSARSPPSPPTASSSASATATTPRPGSGGTTRWRRWTRRPGSLADRLLRGGRAARPHRRPGARPGRTPAARAAQPWPPAAPPCCPRPRPTSRRPGPGGSTAASASSTCCAIFVSPATPAPSRYSAVACRWSVAARGSRSDRGQRRSGCDAADQLARSRAGSSTSHRPRPSTVSDARRQAWVRPAREPLPPARAATAMGSRAGPVGRR